MGRVARASGTRYAHGEADEEGIFAMQQWESLLKRVQNSYQFAAQ